MSYFFSSPWFAQAAAAMFAVALLLMVVFLVKMAVNAISVSLNPTLEDLSHRIAEKADEFKESISGQFLKID